MSEQIPLYGESAAAPITVDAKTTARFWSKVDTSSFSGCWPWIASRSGDGVGAFWMLGAQYRAPRASWLVAHGVDPGDRVICHKCDNPICVRPDHLFLGTQAQNMADMKAKGRQLSGTRNPSATLNDLKVLAIRMEASRGASTRALAARFNVSRRLISFILQGRNWKHVGGPIQAARPQRVLTMDEVSAIRSASLSGQSQAAIAKQFSIAQITVHRILHEKRYRMDSD